MTMTPWTTSWGPLLPESAPDAGQTAPAATVGPAGLEGAARSIRRFRTTDEPDELVDLRTLPSTLPDDELLWVDLPAAGSVIQAAEEAFGLAGVLSRIVERPGPGFEQREEALGLSTIGLEVTRDGPARLLPVHLVATRNTVISVHDHDVAGLTAALDQHMGDRRLARLDAGTFLGLLLEGILTGYYDELERLERRVDRFDERALRGDAGPEMLDDLLNLRRWISRLRRSLALQREVFAGLARPVGDPSPVGTPWPELASRLDQLVMAVEQARESLVGSFDLLMTRAAQQTNEVMRTLTVLSSVLLPAAVIAGIMGMNFPAPFFEDQGNLFVVLALMAALALGTLLLARLRHWI
jgi:magnesium transporter